MNSFARFAIPGLIRYVVLLNVLVFLLMLFGNPIVELIYLDPNLVMQGQVWRLVTWIFIPTQTSPIWAAIYFWFTWWMGDMLEAIWGTVPLNFYYFLGMLGCTVTGFFLGETFGNLILNFSLLLALATLAPDEEILLLFFPLKLKWVALISLVFPWGVTFVGGGLSTQVAIGVCLTNYLIFFGPQIVRQFRDQKATVERRAKFDSAKRELPAYLHKCDTCGITELTDPNADFRVTDDGREYCTDHLPAA